MGKRRISATHTSVQDFNPKCKCGNCAVALLEIHAIDYCTTQPTVASLLCRECLLRSMRMGVNILLDGPDFCPTCGLTFVNLSDMVVRLCPLGRM